MAEEDLQRTEQEERRARAASRRARMKTNVARSWQEAEDWDLRFWQGRTPEERLSTLVALRRDAQHIRAARQELDEREKSSG